MDKTEEKQEHLPETSVQPAGGVSIDELQKEKQATELEMKELEKTLKELMTSINELEISLVSKGKDIIQTTEKLENAEKKNKSSMRT